MSADPTGAAGLDGVDLRALVRELLLEALPPRNPLSGVDAGVSVDGPTDLHTGRSVEVRVESDADLAALVQLVATECADPERQAALAADGTAYRLARTTTSASASAADRSDAPAATASAVLADVGERPVLRVERGAVTERTVREAARTGAVVRTARGVVVTPLARDRARSAGVPIEKEA